MINFIRKSLLNAYTVFPLLICLLIAGWSTQAKPLTANHRYSGEEMFRGLFFGEGRYAEAIPELQSLQLSYSKKLAKPVDEKAVRQVRSQIVQYIQTQQPRYFENLQVAFESGNPTKVQAALESGRAITAKAIEHLMKDKNKAQFEIRRETGTCIVIANYCTIIAMCAVIMMIQSEELAQGDSKLLTEQLVASICQVAANPS
ncbi:hypothetical protein [Spirosoma radiotolerans]|uniref:Uncharacterized protein n=1 Tax=Spirosoma radiotolerans TaxID=1379870 RepID=A0A0E3ZWT6_9BACT|nr:hypothetical protein [Spirosoma radiotolerans]AKD55840.1 hypothetical protein SD10_13965 [Spirosoma radiotolerans]